MWKFIDQLWQSYYKVIFPVVQFTSSETEDTHDIHIYGNISQCPIPNYFCNAVSVKGGALKGFNESEG